MLVQRSIAVLSTCKTCSFPSKLSTFFPKNNSLLLLTTTLSFSTLKKSRPLKIRALHEPVARNGGDSDTFLAEETVSWASLGVSEPLSQALSNVGLPRPSLVQAACIPTILEGDDIVVAAETGSGKTHGYLVPIFQKLCSTMDASHTDDRKLNKNHHVSLVLCPNVMLCEQVVRMANSLHNAAGEPLLKTAAICGRQGLFGREPDVIVSTPVALLNYLYAIDVDRHSRAHFLRSVKFVVFDEADLLLCGSFQNQIVRLINMLRFDEKLLSRLKSGEIHAKDASDLSVNAIEIEHEQDLEAVDFLEEDEDEVDDDGSVVEELESKSEVTNRRDWRRVRKIYERSKQYIFVAATLPLNGKKTAGGILKKMFPDANWVSGNYLHCQNPRLKQNWVEITTDTQVDVLINAVKNGLSSSASDIIRTMVFVNTVEAAEAVAKILTRAGISCLRYHRDVSLEERTNNIATFQQEGGVFVCTDAAARGLDVPNVSHVIQAEFASSAVDFLHRVGRTARAGHEGLVTNLFTTSNQDLVSAVRRAEKQGLPVEKAFSRKRGFRNKMKKGIIVRDEEFSSIEQVLA